MGLTTHVSQIINNLRITYGFVISPLMRIIEKQKENNNAFEMTFVCNCFQKISLVICHLVTALYNNKLSRAHYLSAGCNFIRGRNSAVACLNIQDWYSTKLQLPMGNRTYFKSMPSRLRSSSEYYGRSKTFNVHDSSSVTFINDLFP